MQCLQVSEQVFIFAAAACAPAEVCVCAIIVTYVYDVGIGELKTVTDYSGATPVTVYSNKVDTVIRTPYELNANAYCQIIYVCDCGCAIDDCCDCPVIY